MTTYLSASVSSGPCRYRVPGSDCCLLIRDAIAGRAPPAEPVASPRSDGIFNVVGSQIIVHAVREFSPPGGQAFDTGGLTHRAKSQRVWPFFPAGLRGLEAGEIRWRRATKPTPYSATPANPHKTLCFSRSCRNQSSTASTAYRSCSTGAGCSCAPSARKCSIPRPRRRPSWLWRS